MGEGLPGHLLERLGLRHLWLGQALAALRSGDTLAVTALFRLTRSLADALDLLKRLTDLQVTLADDRLCFRPNAQGLELLADGLTLAGNRRSVLHSQRTREGLRVARTRGQLTSRGPKMNPVQEQFVVESYLTGRLGAGDLGELFGVSRSTIYRTLRRAKQAAEQQPVSTP